MKTFIEKNKKYLIYLLAGLFLMTSSSFLSFDNEKTDEKEREFTLFLEKMFGEDNESVFLNRDENGSVKGVIIAIKGADNPNVKNKVIQAAQIAFDVPAHKIKVFEYQEESK